jgi:hypothetical protein
MAEQRLAREVGPHVPHAPLLCTRCRSRWYLVSHK